MYTDWVNNYTINTVYGRSNEMLRMPSVTGCIRYILHSNTKRNCAPGKLLYL